MFSLPETDKLTLCFAVRFQPKERASRMIKRPPDLVEVKEPHAFFSSDLVTQSEIRIPSALSS